MSGLLSDADSIRHTFIFGQIGIVCTLPQIKCYGKIVVRMIYTHENRFIVANAKNILEAHGIDIVVKNEYSSSAIGEISPFDAWVELWVLRDDDYERAFQIIESSLSEKNATEWVCRKCKEKNDASFELCWSCQSENS
ncbi:MAG: DUF2007 domain-containing protein [Exilibacterium sp.]